MATTGDEAGGGPEPVVFGHVLKHLRTAADSTQEELAARAGVSARLVSDLERGAIQRPRRDTIRMLADGLRLSDADRGRPRTRGRRRLNTRSSAHGAEFGVPDVSSHVSPPDIGWRKTARTTSGPSPSLRVGPRSPSRV